MDLRRLTVLVALTALTGGCAMTDRFAYEREDPVIWFLSGMPAPYDLNWPAREIPELPVLNPPDYVPPPAIPPLDYPRGWNPDHPPLVGVGGDAPVAQPAADGDAIPPAPTPASCGDSCDLQQPASPASAGDAAGAAAGAGVLAGDAGAQR
jgi:hypothetical protein